MTSSRSHRDAALQQQAADLVDNRRAPHDPAFAHPGQGLHVQLFVTLDRHEAHLRLPYRFSAIVSGVDEVVLVGLHKRLLHTAPESGAPNALACGSPLPKK